MSTSSEGSKNSPLIKSPLLKLLGEWMQTPGTKISGWTLYAFPNYCSYDSSRLSSTQQTIPEVVAFLPLVY